jgi:formylglycine-generating enzyme required for sulfatase activity
MMGSDTTDPHAEDDEFAGKAAGKKEKHRVRITRPFYPGAHEVTRGQFRRFVDDAGYRTEAEQEGQGDWGWNENTRNFERNQRYTWQNVGFEQTDEHPVANVSWNDAMALAEWLSRKEGETYRLPTEAEWEYACRAGTTTRYSCGDAPEGLAAVGNVADGTLKAKFPRWESQTIAARDVYVYTAPVGCYIPNAWGLFDMHGNVWEWCSDWYAEDYYKRSPVEDPENTVAALYRVRRSGGWYFHPRSARSAQRGASVPDCGSSYLGFRLARVVRSVPAHI